MIRKTPAPQVLAAVFLLGLTSCDQNLLPDPESRAAVVPQEADVAVGATHDLLVAACQDKVTLTDLVLPVAATTIFVGLGRLDALFYLPEAEVAAAIPQCEPVEYGVSSPAVDGAAIVLEPTGNPRAFKAHVQAAGETRFSAKVQVDGEELDVQSTLRGHVPNRVQFAPRCDPTFSAETGKLENWLPAGRAVEFPHRLFRDELPLSGYGLYAVDDPRLSIRESGYGAVVVELPAQRGDLSLSSRFDPSFSLNLHLYDRSDIDGLTVEAPPEPFFVGHVLSVTVRASIGGKVPCVWAFPRTVTIETPDVCGFDGRPDLSSLSMYGNGTMPLKAAAPGMCRVRVALEGTSLSDVVELPVYRTFEPVPFDAELHPAIHLTDLWVSSANELFIVGWKDDVAGNTDGVVFRRSNGVWDRMLQPRGALLRAVHGSRTDGAVFAVGNNGRVARRAGADWTVLDTGVNQTLFDVWVFSANDVYAVGDNGTFLHFDGSKWTSIPTGGTARFISIWGASPNDIWLVGRGLVMLRYRNGTLESALPAQVPAAFNTLNGISATALDDVWVVDNDSVLRSDGQSWTQYPLVLPTGNVLRSIWAVGDGSAYALSNNTNSSSGESHARWLGPTRTMALPVTGAVAITGLGTDVYVLSDKRLFHYVHDPASGE
jgi:hypothetical protein